MPRNKNKTEMDCHAQRSRDLRASANAGLRAKTDAYAKTQQLTDVTRYKMAVNRPTTIGSPIQEDEKTVTFPL
jgi:hypothetical protein